MWFVMVDGAIVDEPNADKPTYDLLSGSYNAPVRFMADHTAYICIVSR